MMANNNINVRQACSTDKKSLMAEIYKFGFIVDELKLYLDTHPNDQDAINSFNEARSSYADAVKSYTKLFGPLLVSMYEPESKWSWNSGPMPWEGEV